jgi:filamentous hemagglutinin
MGSSRIRLLKIDNAQFGAKVGRHMLEFGRNPGNAADRVWLTQHIHEIYANPTQIRDGTFSGQGAVLPIGSNARGPVWFYAKGNDVVVTDRSDNFVTILKNGAINSTSFLNAKILLGRP